MGRSLIKTDGSIIVAKLAASLSQLRHRYIEFTLRCFPAILIREGRRSPLAATKIPRHLRYIVVDRLVEDRDGIASA